MSRKIAPTLTYLVDRWWVTKGPGSDPARKELRALLAVARAAKRQHARGRPSWPEADALHRALARLDRVSGRKP